jgi:beta-hydroxylase
MLDALLAEKFIIIYAWLGCALFVHFRGTARLPFHKQLLDHSTFLLPYNIWVYLFSGVTRQPILDAKDFPELVRMRENWEVIAAEARELFDAGHIRDAEKRDDIAFNTFFRRRWKRFYLKWYHDVLPSANELCPRTAELVASTPSLNAALFAYLAPGSRLGVHRDPFAGSLRYHLGLVTPNDDHCRIYIDGNEYSWRDGEDVLFDETYLHEAKNETEEGRIILFCDVARPVRTPVFRAINRFVTRHVASLTSSRNVETERLGAMNLLARVVHKLQVFFTTIKRWNRRAYYAGKYVLVALLFYLVFFPDLRG